MSGYALLSDTFWTGATGRMLRNEGQTAQLVAIYLVSCASRKMCGIYYLPLALLHYEIGCSKEEACKALRSVEKAQFGKYDFESEWVFVYNMAKIQIGEDIQIRGKHTDKRLNALIRQLTDARKSPFLKEFWLRYSEAYHLPEAYFDANGVMLETSPFLGASRKNEKTVSPPVYCTLYSDTGSETDQDLYRAPVAAAVERPVTSAIGEAISMPRVNGVYGRACEIYIIAHAKEIEGVLIRGTAPGGEIGNYLKPLIKRHGEEMVLSAWETYWDVRRSEDKLDYSSAGHFSKTFPTWAAGGPRQRTKGGLTREAVEWVPEDEKGGPDDPFHNA